MLQKTDPGVIAQEDILTVSEFTDRIKALVEMRFAFVRIRGEISNLRIQSSGHAYFTLKDVNSQLSAVVFRGRLAGSSTKLKEGMEIVAIGEISIYKQRGNYQLIISEFYEEGLGRLQAKFEALKKKLNDEGLFDKSKKKVIPPMPKKIAFVTSPTGAAIRDFISILRRLSWKGYLLVIPAKVQGEGAADDIVKGIKAAEMIPDLDLLVVGRGGGSLEDLWCFNEEIVARTIFESSLPIISAVGHEIDYTLSDFTSDLRAETPSAAAELIASSFLKLKERFDFASENLEDSLERLLNEKSQMLDILEVRLKKHSPENRLAFMRQRLINGELGFKNAVARYIQLKNDKLSSFSLKLEKYYPEQKLNFLKMRLSQLDIRLKSAGIDATLKRGFVMVKDAHSNKVIDSSKEIGFAQIVKLQFSDGEVSVEGRDLN